MILLKYLADILTSSRIAISILLIWLGWAQGAEGFRLAIILLLVSWGTDILDGSIARLSEANFSTWIGNHDLHFDIAVAGSLLVYMTSSHCINLSISIIYFLVWVFIFWRIGLHSETGKLIQAPIYGWFMIVAFQREPIFAWFMVIFLLLAIIFTWPRFPQETVPNFIDGFTTKQNISSDTSASDFNSRSLPHKITNITDNSRD